MFELMALAALITAEVWTLKAARSIRDTLLALAPLAATFVTMIVAAIFTSGIVTFGLWIGLLVACFVAIIKVGGGFRDRAMREIIEGAG